MTAEEVTRAHRRWLLFGGALLFLLGLLTGVAVQAFTNPRMGLSAHLAGVQNALVLWVLGAVWRHLHLPVRQLALACWTSLYGMYAFWAALTLAAVWGTSRATPIAGSGFTAMPAKEMVVQVLLYSASASAIAGAVLIVWGFWKSLRLRAG